MLYFLFLYFIYNLELFQQCCIFCFSIGIWSYSSSAVFSVFLLEFGAVPAVLYFLFSIGIWSCSSSVVFSVFHVYFISRTEVTRIYVNVRTHDRKTFDNLSWLNYELGKDTFIAAPKFTTR